MLPNNNEFRASISMWWVNQMCVVTASISVQYTY